MDFIEHILVAAGVFVAIDSIWLTFIANKFYKGQIGGLLATKPNFIAAGIFYLLYMIGLVVFAIDPALDNNSLSFAFGHGALLGLVMYATYDLTNKATLKNWPTKLVAVDMTWGTVITSVVATVTFLIFN